MAKAAGISKELESAITKLMKETMKSPDATLTDKMKVIDRALKLEMLKQKVIGDGFGGGFTESEIEEE